MQINGIIPLRNIQHLVVLLIPNITIVIIAVIMVLMIFFDKLLIYFLLQIYAVSITIRIVVSNLVLATGYCILKMLLITSCPFSHLTLFHPI